MSPTAKIIDGKAIADQIQQEIKDQVRKLNLRPGLAVILVGNDPASELYVSLKARAAGKCGILFCLYKFAGGANEEEILSTVNWLNQDREIDGILIQLPLPPNFNANKIIKTITPNKDADGFHPDNIEKLLAGQEVNIIPGLNLGIIQLLNSTGENLAGKKTLIIARGQEFTQTLAHLLKEFSTGSETISPDDPGVKIKSQDADIIIAAVGQPNWLKAGDIKEGAIVIDVGTNHLDKKTIVGDVDFAGVSAKAGWITPVPGGAGPMTVAMLLKNTAALNLIHKKIFA